MIAIGIVLWVAALAAVAWWGYRPDKVLRAKRDTLAAVFADVRALAEADAAETVDFYEYAWRRLIDPDSPEYNALAEFAHNLNPTLRKVPSP